jgi:DHA2 family methylenomycin A resistance protein-like MFS transporter
VSRRDLAHPALALAATCTGFFMVLLDTTIVNVALPAIGRDVGGSTSDLQWVVNAYTLAFAAFLLSGGALSDRLGARRVFVGGLAAFGLASILCSLAPGLGLLVAGRALQGAAAAVMVPSSLSLIAHTFREPRARARAIGIWIGSSGIAGAGGPLLGGVLVDGPGWRAIFWINVPIAAAGAVLALRTVPSAPRTPGRRLDLTGQALAVVFLLAITAGLIESGQRGWSSGWVWGLLAIGAAGVGAFVVVERREPHPAVPIGLFASGRFSATMVIGALINLGFYGELFVLSLYFQEVHGYSALETGLAFLPLFSTTFVLSWLAGHMTGRRGPVIPMSVGLGVGLTGFLLLLPIGAHTSYWALIPGLLLVSSGALIPAPLSAAAIASAPDAQSGVVSGILNASRQMGSAFGIAVLGSLVARGEFITGMREAFLVSCGAYALALALTLVYLRERAPSSASAVTVPRQ